MNYLTVTEAMKSKVARMLLSGNTVLQIKLELGLQEVAAKYFISLCRQEWAEGLAGRSHTDLSSEAVAKLEMCLVSAWDAYNAATMGFTTDSTTEISVLSDVAVVTGKKMSQKARTDANRWMNTILQIQKELRDLQGVTPPEHTVVEHIDRETPRDALLAKLSSLRVVNEDGDAVDVD